MRNWRKYDRRADVVYRAAQMSPAELLAGYRYANVHFIRCKASPRAYPLAGSNRLDAAAQIWPMGFNGER